MLLLLHAIIPCLHTRIVLHLCGSVNSELQTMFCLVCMHDFHMAFPAYKV